MVSFRSVPERKEPNATQLATDNAVLNRKNAKLNEQIEQLNQEIEAKNREISEKEALIKGYEASNNSLTVAKEEIQTLQSQLAQLQEEKAFLSAQLENALVEAEKLEKELEEERSNRAKDVETFKNQIAEIEEKYNGEKAILNSQVSEKVEKLEEARKQIKTYEEEIQRLKFSNDSLQSSIDSMVASGNDDAAAIEELTKTLAISQNAEAQLSVARDALEAKANVLSTGLKSYIEAVEEATKASEASKNQTESEMEEVLSALLENESKLDFYIDSLDRVQKRAQKAELQAIETINATNDIADRIREQLIASEAENEELKVALEMQQAVNKELEYGIAVITDKLYDAEAKIAKLSDEILGYQAQIEASEEINTSELSNLKNALQEQVNAVSKLKGELSEKSKELGRTKGSLTNSKNANVKKDAENKELQAKVKSLEKEIAEAQKEANVKLNSINDLINENNLLKEANKILEEEKAELQNALATAEDNLKTLRDNFDSLDKESKTIAREIDIIYDALMLDGEGKTTIDKIKEIDAKLNEQEEAIANASMESLRSSTENATKFMELNRKLADANAELEKLREEVKQAKKTSINRRVNDNVEKQNLKNQIKAGEAEIAELTTSKEEAVRAKAQAEEEKEKAEEAKVKAQNEKAVAEEAQRFAEERRAEAVNQSRLYDQIVNVIHKEFDKHYDKYIIIKEDEEQTSEKASWGLYRAVEKARKASKKDAENRYDAIVESIVVKYDNILSIASEERKAELAKSLPKTVSITDGKATVETIINKNTSKVKGTVKKASIIAAALAVTTALGAVGATTIKVVSDQNDLIAQKKEGVLATIADFNLTNENAQKAEIHYNNYDKAETMNLVSATTIKSEYDASYENVMGARDMANALVELDENGNLVESSALGEAFANYEVAVRKNNKSNMKKYSKEIDAYSVEIKGYADTASTNFTNMLNESGYSVDIDGIISSYEEELAEKDQIIKDQQEELKKYETITLTDLDTNSEAYKQLEILFAGSMTATGTIIITDFIYQGSTGKVNITYDKCDIYGRITKDCNQSYEISPELANGNMVLGELNEKLSSQTAEKSQTADTEEEIQP